MLSGNRKMTKIIRACFAIFLLFFFSMTSTIAFAEEDTNEDHYTVDTVYKLGSGDKLKITVYEEPDLSGEFEIDGSGVLAMPLVGNINAGGKDIRTLEKKLLEKLSNGYLVNPRISIEIMNFRPFFILGEVNEPGSYPYVSGLTVVNAVALAGGYTHRARTGRVTIIRGKGKNKEEFEAEEDSSVMPGDSIRVSERFF